MAFSHGKARRHVVQRCFAPLYPITDVRVRHYRGFPPELAGGSGTRTMFSVPDALLLEEREDEVLLIRITADGGIVGDTWHASIDDALEQIRFEYPAGHGDWTTIPDAVDDPYEYVSRMLSTARPDSAS